jgi:hypothetical protein
MLTFKTLWNAYYFSSLFFPDNRLQDLCAKFVASECILLWQHMEQSTRHKKMFSNFLFKLDGWNMFKEEGQNDFVNVSYYMGTIIYSVINALIFCSDPCFPILKTQFIFFIFFMFSNFFFSFLQARKLYALNKWIHSPWRNMEQSSKNVQTCSRKRDIMFFNAVCYLSLAQAFFKFMMHYCLKLLNSTVFQFRQRTKRCKELFLFVRTMRSFRVRKIL